MRNPFQLVYDELFSIVAKDPRVQALVRPKNAIAYNQPAGNNPTREVLNPADTPEITLVSSGASFNLHNTSTTCMVTRRYQWMIATGSYNLSKDLYALEWGAFCAMVEWRSRLTVLTWPEGVTADYAHFVKVLRAADLNEGIANSGLDRGAAGFSALWAVDIDMYFRTQDLRQYLALPPT